MITMKKMMFISTIALVLSVGAISAQESRFGVKGGLNLSTLTTDDFDDKNLKTRISYWSVQQSFAGRCVGYTT